MCHIVSVFSFIRPPRFFQVIGETWNSHMLYGWSHLSSSGIVVDRVQLKFFGITFVIVVPNTTFWSFSKLLSLSALSEWIVAVAASEKKCDSSLPLLSLRGNFVSFPRGLPITAAHLLLPRVALPVNWIFIFFSLLQVLAIRKFDLFDSGFNRNNLILPYASVTCHYTIGGCIGRRVFIDWLNFLDRRKETGYKFTALSWTGVPSHNYDDASNSNFCGKFG